MGATRADLHRLIDQLPDSEVSTAGRLLEALHHSPGDPVLQAAVAAPLDDEPVSPEEAAAVDDARGDTSVSTDDLGRLLHA